MFVDGGDLKFKHDEQKLELRVKTTEDAVKSQRSKDASTLSGGEKSVSFRLSTHKHRPLTSRAVDPSQRSVFFCLFGRLPAVPYVVWTNMTFLWMP